MSTQLKIQISDRLYLRDPNQTELGQKLLKAALEMIDHQGFEALTFKKLAQSIHSTEASIYRYFENKYQLLSYLVAWYWEWLAYRVEYETHNLVQPEARLKKALELLAAPNKDSQLGSPLDPEALARLVVTESPRLYAHLSQAHLSPDEKVPESVENIEKGFFHGYQLLCLKIGVFMQEINPCLKNPVLLVSTLVETAQRQLLFSRYLPFLTDFQLAGENSAQVSQFLEEMAMTLIRTPPC